MATKDNNKCRGCEKGLQKVFVENSTEKTFHVTESGFRFGSCTANRPKSTKDCKCECHNPISSMSMCSMCAHHHITDGNEDKRISHIELLLTTWFCKTYKNVEDWSANYLNDTKKAKKDIMKEIKSLMAARETELREERDSEWQKAVNRFIATLTEGGVMTKTGRYKKIYKVNVAEALKLLSPNDWSMHPVREIRTPKE